MIESFEDSCTINFTGGHSLTVEQGQPLAESLISGKIDGLIIEALWGFNDLGGYGRIICKLLGIEEARIREECVINLDRIDPTLILIKSTADQSTLKAVVLVPTQNGRSYQRWVEPMGHRRPYRDFYYNVSYESIKLLADLGCSNIGIAGITGSLAHYRHIDVGNSIADGIVHYALKNPHIRCVASIGDGPSIVSAIKYYKAQPEMIEMHREIRLHKNHGNEITTIELNWWSE